MEICGNTYPPFVPPGATSEARTVRIIDGHYNLQFTVQDGEWITVNGEPCQVHYIDETHFRITGTFAMLLILGITTMILANKFFSLIHYLPEHVTNWIGQQFHNLGEKEDLAGARGTFATGGQATAGAVGGAIGSGVRAVQKYAQEKQNKDNAQTAGNARGYAEKDFM